MRYPTIAPVDFEDSTSSCVPIQINNAQYRGMIRHIITHAVCSGLITSAVMPGSIFGVRRLPTAICRYHNCGLLAVTATASKRRKPDGRFIRAKDPMPVFSSITRPKDTRMGVTTPTVPGLSRLRTMCISVAVSITTAPLEERSGDSTCNGRDIRMEIGGCSIAGQVTILRSVTIPTLFTAMARWLLNLQRLPLAVKILAARQPNKWAAARKQALVGNMPLTSTRSSISTRIPRVSGPTWISMNRIQTVIQPMFTTSTAVGERTFILVDQSVPEPKTRLGSIVRPNGPRLSKNSVGPQLGTW
jgi:hypothetical protein